MRCYFVTMCLSSSLDRETNSFSLFNIVEELQVAPFEPGAAIQVSAHIYFETEPEDVGKSLESRTVWISDVGVETPSVTVNPIPVASSDRVRVRTRSLFMRLPPTLGRYRLVPEWREVGTDRWVRSDMSWSLVVQVGAIPA